MKQAIVSGATGFIEVFVELLVNKGIRVLALGRKPFQNCQHTKKPKEQRTYVWI